MALSGADPPVVVIGELKLAFNLELVLQGVDRAASCDEVWLAARLSSREKGRENDARFRNLCRRLGFGLLGVRSNGEVDVLVSPTSPAPRKNPGRRSRLVEEHRRRRGDPVEGGGSRKPIMTAYRQRALACAAALAQGARRPRDLRWTYQTLLISCAATSMGGSCPSSGESTPWPSLAEPPFCAGRSRRRRPQPVNDGSGPRLVLVGNRPLQKSRNRVICRRTPARLSAPAG
jgi:hypothetical protein